LFVRFGEKLEFCGEFFCIFFGEFFGCAEEQEERWEDVDFIGGEEKIVG
jgi:hypothetical protein